MTSVRSILSVLLLAAVLPAAGDTFTNHAGQVVSGTVLRVSATEAWLSAGSDTNRVPLRVFPPSERRRLRAAGGTPETPRTLRSEFALCQAQIRRSRQLLARGRCTQAASDAFCEKCRRILSNAVTREQEAGRLTADEARMFLESAAKIGAVTPAS